MLKKKITPTRVATKKNTEERLLASQLTQNTSFISEENFKKYVLGLKSELKQKKYEQVEEEISLKEYLFTYNQKYHFTILVLKISAALKQINFHLNNTFNYENLAIRNRRIELLLLRTKKDIDKIISVSDSENKAQYEKCTELYMNLLYYKAINAKRKGQYVSAFSYLSISMNIMKVFHVKMKKAYKIRTYFTYSMNILFLIKLLIEDCNYQSAIKYQDIYFKITLTMILMMDDNFSYENKYYNLICYYLSICFLYRGICFESLQVREIFLIIDAYNQANYFSQIPCGKARKNFSIEFITKNIIEQIKLTLDKERLSKHIRRTTVRRRTTQMRRKSNLSVEIPREIFTEKKEIAPYSVNGPIQRKRFRNIERIIDNKLMLNDKSSDMKLVEFLDSNLGMKSRNLSPEIKKNICHHYIYSKLLSKKFKEFVTGENNFQFDNPAKNTEAMSDIRHYLDKQIEMAQEKEKRATITMKEKKLKKKPIKTAKTKLRLSTSPSSRNKMLIFNQNISSYSSQSVKSKKKKKDNIFSKKYFNKFSFLDKKEDKELQYQKSFLGMKSSNSNEYFLNHHTEVELDDLAITEEATKSFQMIKNKVTRKLEEFNYSKFKSQRLYNMIFDSSSKKKGGLKMGKLLAKYRWRNRNRDKCIDFSQFIEKNKVLNLNMEQIFKLDRDIEKLDSEIGQKKKNISHI